jgi:hypothetical protein
MTDDGLLICDDDLRTVMLCWPYLAPHIRQKIERAAMTGVPSEFLAAYNTSREEMRQQVRPAPNPDGEYSYG